MKYKSTLFNLFLLLFLPTLHADDTSFGGQGASPFPTEEPNIKMVNEHIIISGRDLNKDDHGGTWTYSCDFTFQNTTSDSITLRMGFPFPLDTDFDNIIVPAGYSLQKGKGLVYDFAVTVNQQPIQTEHRKIIPNEKKGLFYKDAYLWNLTFPPNQAVKIHHNYVTGATFDVMGYTWVSYVLKTGGLWQDGIIGQAILEVKPNTSTRLCSELDPQADYLEATPKGLEITGAGKNRQYNWELSNFHPESDVSLCLQTGRNYVRYKLILPLLQSPDEAANQLQQMTQEQKRFLRNTIYAQYGRKFQSVQLQTYFNKQWWYEENPDYSDSLLTPEDKQVLTLIQKFEKSE